jgi:ribosomal protein L12E/L44/L45/RPP1/RPP2
LVWSPSQLKQFCIAHTCCILLRFDQCGAMASAAEQQCAPAPTSNTLQELAEGTQADGGLSDASGGRGASPSPDLDDEQQRRQCGVLDGSAAAVDGADRPTAATAAEASPGASGSASGAPAPSIASSPTMKEKILALKEEQRALRASNKAKTREIRNAERRSKRLKTKVGGLTDEDLNEVLRARAEAKAVASPKAGAKAKASPKCGAASRRRSGE